MSSSLPDLIRQERISRRELSRQKLIADRNSRLQKLVVAIPRLGEIQDAFAQIALDLGRLALGEKGCLGRSVVELQTLSNSLQEERRRLLAANHIPPEYLEIWWECPKCQDTGYVGTEKCQCLVQAEIDTLYHRSGLPAALLEETFDRFDATLYPEEVRDHMLGVRDACLGFADRVSRGLSTDGLLILGDVGRGKTFLCSAVANRILQAGRTCIYLTFANLLDLIRKARFEDSAEGRLNLDLLETVDLLILDDLGAEKPSDFVMQELFKIVNGRVNARLPMVISTNLFLKELEETYDFRVVSRIIGASQLLKVEGEDIRLLKKRLAAERAATRPAAGPAAAPAAGPRGHRVRRQQD